MTRTDTGGGHHGVIDLHGELSLEDVLRVARAHEGDFPHVQLQSVARDKMLRIRAKLSALIPVEVMYGVNTGCGANRNRIISVDDLLRYQEKYIMTHSVGFGQPAARDVVRAMMLLRVNSFSLGNSAMTVELCDLLCEMLNLDITPVVPEFGSVGASGDLVPLAHLGAVLIGLPWAEVFYKGERRNAREVFAEAHLGHHVLQPKEAMGLTNGATFILANAALAVADALDLLELATLAAAMHAEAMRGEQNAFDLRIHDARNQSGQIAVAESMLEHLKNSARTTRAAQLADFACEVTRGPAKGPRVQDQYSLRCVPQAHGAVLDALLHLSDIVLNEVNASTDNPLVFEGPDGHLQVLSGGNFHGDPLSIPIDAAITGLAKLANISDCRLYRLLNHHWSHGLPDDLAGSSASDNTGFMIVQYSVASRVMHLQGLAGAAYASLSRPTSFGQEDHVSNGANSAWALNLALEDVRFVLAAELLANCQAIDLGTEFLADNAQLGVGTQRAYDVIRAHVAPMGDDRSLYPDLQATLAIVRSGALSDAIHY